MTHMILSNLVASVSELKKSPVQMIKEAKGEPIAILDHNQPIFYCISPSMFEALLEKIEDEELVKTIKKRANEKEIEIAFDDL